MIKDFFQCDPSARMTGDKRREQILQTAVDLFSQRGFRGTTTKEIARASGISEAMVFRHFATKDALYQAILDNKGCQDGVENFPWEENEVLKKALADKDDFAVLYHIALDSLNKHSADVGFMRLLIYASLEEHELAERFFSQFVERIYQYIGEYISVRQKDGAMREINPRVVVRSYMGMIIHHSLNNILWDKKRHLLNISNEDAAKNFAEILLRGVAV